MKQTILILGIIFLLVGVSINPSASITTKKKSIKISNEGNTLFVGGSGPNNYTRIQDAIDNASDGDTVFVYNGTYPHNVYIDKSIRLIGEDKNNTIIEGGWLTYVRINADDVIVTGFTVRDCGFYYSGGIDIDDKSSNVTIIGNNLSDNVIIGVSNLGNNNYILNNTIKGNNEGIKLAGSNNTISGNIIDSNNFSGIYFVWIRNKEKTYDPIYQNNIIKENIIINNGEGIYIERANNSHITNNLIAYNKWSGITAPYNEPANQYSYKNNTNIKNNTIIYNGYGIFFCESNRTNISNNLIALNERSFYLYNCNKSMIYHNNIISNEKPPIDEKDFSGGYKNMWDNGYPLGGNFWSDYVGIDNYSGPNQNIPGGDGIGDSPYNISGNENSQDRYPLMEPLIILPPVANFTYSVGESPVLFDASSSYDPDGTVISYEWDFGDGNTCFGEITYHKYCKIGVYNVTLTVMDDTGLKDSITKIVDVVVANIPPEVKIDGPNKGKPNIEYEFVFNISDPDGYENFLFIDWGDSNLTGWLGPYGSGEPIKVSHVWDEKGTYVIKVKVKDDCVESEWAEFTVTMPRDKSTSSSFFVEVIRTIRPVKYITFFSCKIGFY